MGISKLPVETLISIISCLETRDKLTCIRVSHHWFKSIRNSCLYQDLIFANGEATNRLGRFKEAFTLFHKHQFLRKQVTHLDLQIHEQPDINTLLTLPRLLPNLTTLKWNVWESFVSTEQWNTSLNQNQVEAFKYWEKLEKIKFSLGAATWPMGLYVLSGADLSHLQGLQINGVQTKSP